MKFKAINSLDAPRLTEGRHKGTPHTAFPKKDSRFLKLLLLLRHNIHPHPFEFLCTPLITTYIH